MHKSIKKVINRFTVVNYKSLILKVLPNAQDYHFKSYQFLKRTFVFLRYIPGNSVWFGPPRGLYHNSESFNETFPEQPIKKQIVKLEEFYIRKLPTTDSTLVRDKFRGLTKVCIQERNIFTLRNARYLYGYGGTVITHDDKIFLPCSPLKNEWYPDKHQSFYVLRTPKLIQLDKVVLVDTLCSSLNYCHWLRDHLMRFSYLKNTGIDFSEYVLVSSFNNTAFQNFSYQKLQEHGFSFKSYLNTKDTKHFQAKELLIPPYLTPAFNTDHFSFAKNEWSFLNEIFKDDTIKNPVKKRVFLSRRKVNRTSKDEVKLIEELVAQFQFEEILLEEYNVSEQAEIFNHAEIIVGLHGAGFTNLCFCKPKTTVVEIFSPDFIVSDFWDIANQRELNYFPYCEDKFYKNLNSYRLVREEPVRFDVEKLIQFIEEALG